MKNPILWEYGTARFEKGEAESYNFTYETDLILADTSEFRLVSENDQLDALSFKTQNLNARVDFTNRVGEFKSPWRKFCYIS